MAQEIKVLLPEHCAAFISQQTRDGRFRSTSEVVELALSLLEEHEARRAELLALFEQADRAHLGSVETDGG